MTTIEYESGSGNVFADLGLEDVEELYSRAFAPLARQGQAATRCAPRSLDGRSATAIWSPRPNGVNPFGLWLERFLQPRSQSPEEDS